MAANRSTAIAERRYSVYVIELKPCEAPEGSKGAVYVGQSWHSPQHRFEQHKQGIRAARVVNRSWVRLNPGLSKGWGPYETRQESERAEAELAVKLRRKGYRVYGGH